MRLLFVILLSIIATFGFGQQVNAPDPKAFTQSASGQDASGFSLSGFNSTATLLCAVGLPTAPTGTSFYFTTTSGVTASTGYSMSGNKTRISFTGTQASINSVLASMKINTTATAGTIQISVSATVNPTGYFYLPTNGHFYRPMSGFTGVTAFSGTSPTAYNNLKTYCTQQTFKGQTGYLMTITSADEDNFVINNVPGNNIIFALTDNVTEGTFKIDAGPETGTTVRIGGTNQQGQYNNWAGGEPNNWGAGEDYVVTKWNGSQWNDFGPEATAFPGGLGGYVIEYGTWTNPDDQTFTEFYNNSTLHSNGPDVSLKAFFNFSFGGNIDETKFSTNLNKRNNSTSNWTGGSFVALNGLGRVTLTPQLDTVKVFSTAIQAATQNDMQAYGSADIGKIYKMTITGAQGGGWGTDIYTSDSYIPAMAVHSGVITIGQTKEVFIQVVEGQNSYVGSTRNGITTSGWGGWGLSYKFVSEPSSYKATITAGQAEFSYVNISNGVTTLYIDLSRFGSTVPSTIKNVKILDVYDGDVTFLTSDIYWAQYRVPSQLPKVTDGTSAFVGNIRNAGYNNWAFTSNISFSQLGSYKQHKLVFNNYDSTQLKTLYGSIVTVSDVYLAFKELANGGIFGNQSGNEFTYGIQFDNADVDDDGVFDESDCFDLLQDLTGKKPLVSNYTLDNTMKIILDTTYGQIGKSNWSTFPIHLGKEYGFTLQDGKTNYTYNLAVTWKGDVNLSHSPTPPSNGITTNSANFGYTTKSVVSDPTGYVISQIVGDSLVSVIKFNPNDHSVVGIQFQLNYDNSIIKYSGTDFKTTGSPINFGTDKGSYINLGSLNTSGELLDNTTEYKVVFKLNKQIPNSLGLISISTNEAVNKDGKTLKIKIQ